MLQLPDGRRLGYVEYGEPNGKPVFLFHGAPGTRNYWGLMPGCPFRAGVRIIAPDRPGYGLSDLDPKRTYADWPDDVVALADSLKVDRFAVAGVSGGGPFALACAWKIPEKLTNVGVISSLVPLLSETLEGVSQTNRFFYSMARHTRWLIRLNMAFAAYMVQREPYKLIDRIKYKLSESDRSALERPQIRKVLAEDLLEGYGNGGRPMTQDIKSQARPWPFRLEEIGVEVHVWQPEDDTSTPRAMGEYLGKTIPICHVHFVPAAGHLWHIEHMGEVLEVLVP